MSEAEAKSTLSGGEKPVGKARRKLPPVTDALVELLDVVATLVEEDRLGRFPTVKRIAIRIGKAKSTVGTQLESLKDRGCIDGQPYIIHGCNITPVGYEIVELWRSGSNNGHT